MQDTTSYWQATHATALPRAELPATADLVVVGGGWLGACSAYYAARRGARVVLLERGPLAFGASGRNGGFMVAGTAEDYPAACARLGQADARAIWHLTLENRALLRTLLAEERIDCDYREPGNLRLALSAADLAAYAQEVAALRADGLTAAVLDRGQTQAMVQTPLGPLVVGALFMPENGLLHSARLVTGVAQAAGRHGAQLCADTAVQRLEPIDGGVRVITARGTLTAGAVIVAANGLTDALVPALRGLVVPVRGQALAYEPSGPAFAIGLGASITATGEYWQQTLDGSIVIGGCRSAAVGNDVGVREHTTTAEVQAAIEAVLPTLFPRLHGLPVARRWAGTMAFTSDYNPVADRAPALPGVWVTGGFCGHGMPFGAVLGSLLAQAALENQNQAALAPLRLDRPTLTPFKTAS